VAEARKELLKSAIVAMLLACLLAAITYYFFEPQGGLPRIPLALGEVPQNHYSILNGDCLILDAVFSNGSAITIGPLSADISQGIPTPGGYSGEFNASGLKTIILSINGFGVDLGDATTIIRALVAFRRDRIIDVTLIDENKKMRDLGESQSIGFVKAIHAGLLDFNQAYYQAILDQLQASLKVTRQQASGRGYWRIADYVWRMNVDKLTNVLQGSGTAQITCILDVTMDLKFGVFRTAGENLTGGTNLKWTGTWGTLELTHENGEITWVKYKSSFIGLVMQ